ncbi:MAG: AMMECR1 domain-containing protein [Gammaproteobacteria bacterium]|nr:MAG: AMMECR1 domain-containing protein [Gammaproteobacteria bacterium]
MAAMDLSNEDKNTLFTVASESLVLAVNSGHALNISLPDYSSGLVEPGAAFVTLTKQGRLRGCIGSLQAWRPLVEDVAENTLASALRDPRFPSVQANELTELDISLSVLTPPQEMTVLSEADLLEQLVPNEDGLILTCGNHRATYLPSVWEQLPDKQEFVAQLKVKAGFSPDFWSDKMQCQRYHAISITKNSD